MAVIPEPGRLAVHAMLDAISVYESGDGPDDISLIDLALSRLAQIDDAVVLRDESVDASNLVGGTMVGWYWLIRELADAREVDSLEVISDLRSFLDD